jgi:hypothetical protein
MAQNTAGIKLKYAVEATAGVRPTTGFVYLTGITEIPEIGGQPDALESTTLDNLEYKTYIDGLKDLGGALGFTANDTPALRTAMDTLISAQATALAAGKATWFGVEVPDPIDETMFFTGKASKLGFGGASINGVLQTTIYVTPTGEPDWVANA